MHFGLQAKSEAKSGASATRGCSVNGCKDSCKLIWDIALTEKCVLRVADSYIVQAKFFCFIV